MNSSNMIKELIEPKDLLLSHRIESWSYKVLLPIKKLPQTNRILGFFISLYKKLYMNIHEYQAKEVLKSFGVRIQEGYVANSPKEAKDAALKLSKNGNSDIFVIKAQIHAGGRGKGTIKETGSNGVVIA